MTAVWTGTMRRGKEAGTVTGELRDEWGWVVTLHGTHAPDGSYTLTGTLGKPPSTLRVVGIDKP